MIIFVKPLPRGISAAPAAWSSKKQPKSQIVGLVILQAHFCERLGAGRGGDFFTKFR